MSSRRSLDVPPEALRDYATDERVERVWGRLDESLPQGGPRVRATLWWAAAAMAIVFTAGVFVGARWAAPQSSASVASVAPEPVPNLEPASAPTVTYETPDRGAREPARKKTTRATRRGALHLGETVPAIEGEPIATEPVEVPASEPVVAPPAWAELASQGDIDKAAEVVAAQGGFDAAMQGATGLQLLHLYDIARASGRRDVAKRSLRKAYEQGGEGAPEAALSLAYLLEQDGDATGAAKFFAEYRRLSPRGDLAEDALVQQVEVALEQGDLQRARELADQYRTDFPDGDGLEKLLPRLEVELEKQAASAEAAPGDEQAADAGTAPAEQTAESAPEDSE